MRKALIKLFAASGYSELLAKENALALNAKFRELGSGSELYDLDVLYCVFEFVTFQHEKETDILFWAARTGHLEAVKYLAETYADIHAENNHSLTLAAQNGHFEIVRYLVEVGANLYTYDNALYWAAENGHLEIVKYLVSAGANIHTCEDLVLRFAANKGHF